jgi:hypothetical protein
LKVFGRCLLHNVSISIVSRLALPQSPAILETSCLYTPGTHIMQVQNTDLRLRVVGHAGLRICSIRSFGPALP